MALVVLLKPLMVLISYSTLLVIRESLFFLYSIDIFFFCHRGGGGGGC